MVQASALSEAVNGQDCPPVLREPAGIFPAISGVDPSVTVAELFGRVVRANPDRIAASDANGSVSYTQLWNYAAEFAARLSAAGVRPGDLVGIAAGRSLATIASIIGVVLAGACYIPVDFDDFPAAFFDKLAGQHSIRHWIADAHARQQHSKLWSACSVLALESVSRPSKRDLIEIPAVQIHASSPIYVMYTSGSTGLPKGVFVPHRAVARLVSGQNFIEFGPHQTFLLHSPLSFDASTLELWGSLLHGGTLAIAPAGRLSLDDYALLLRAHNVTTLWMTAAMFHLAAEHAPGMFAPLQQLVFGGDVISPGHVAKIREMYPGLRMVNGYGPTENTTFTCCYVVPQNYQANGSLPIGSPIAHTTAYILDDSLLPVANCEEGELVTGGDGVALGYLNQPEATSEKFVLDPFAGVPDARMYRTGDRVRRCADGAIEFLGRMDRQVKIAGHRVEVAAVESAIAASPLVSETAVSVLTPVSGEKQLAACVRLHDSVGEAEKQLREWIETRLGRASVPQHWLFLEKLPINVNGKIDRSAVQAVCDSQFISHAGNSECPEAADVVAAEKCDPSECVGRLRQLWSQLLRRDSVGDDENFFDLGGTSLLLIEMHARLRSQFSGTPSLVEMFDFPTIRALADRLRTEADANAAQGSATERGQRQRAAMLARRANLSASKVISGCRSWSADAGKSGRQ
jgi:amino acid adenylation domain-containing protein